MILSLLLDSCNPQNLVGACDYYDKCILTIDEVLNKLPHSSVEWKKLLEIRLQYDDRMELLRERLMKISLILIVKLFLILDIK